MLLTPQSSHAQGTSDAWHPKWTMNSCLDKKNGMDWAAQAAPPLTAMKETWPMESSVLVISRVVVAQWYNCCLSEVPYLCNLPLSLTSVLCLCCALTNCQQQCIVLQLYLYTHSGSQQTMNLES